MCTAETPGILFDCQFDFQPVGHGLFYTGRVKDFHFVYDCGSKSTTCLNEAIKNYLGEMYKKTIDLLIISHFHKDHINGIPRLLEAVDKINKVILPYLSPVERLIAVLENTISAEGSIDEDSNNLIFDPVEYFHRNGYTPEFVFLAADELSQGRFRDDLGISSQEGIREPFINEHSCKKQCNWAFKFYYRKCDEQIDKEKQFLKDVTDKGISLENIAEVFKREFSVLQKIYKKVFGSKQNQTSIVCCHGLASGSCGEFFYYEESPIDIENPVYSLKDNSIKMPDAKPITPSISISEPLQMLTGDAELDIAQFESHFASELTHVGVFQVPHHASDSNWENDFLVSMKNCNLWVVSCRSNDNKHPGMCVINELGKKQLIPSICDEDTRISMLANVNNYYLLEI